MSKHHERGQHSFPAPEISLGDSSPEDPKRELERRFFVAEMDHHCPTIDLHGMDRETAIRELDQFIANNISEEHVRVVFGLGTGVLEKAVLDYLNRESRREGSELAGYRRSVREASCDIIFKK